MFFLMGCVGADISEPLNVSVNQTENLINAIPHVPASPGYISSNASPFQIIVEPDFVLIKKADFDALVDPRCEPNIIKRLFAEGVDDIEMLIITRNDPEINTCAERLKNQLFVEKIYTNGLNPLGPEMHSLTINGINFYVLNSKSMATKGGDDADLVLLVEDRGFRFLIPSYTPPARLNQLSVQADAFMLPCNGELYCSYYGPSDKVINLYHDINAKYAVVQRPVSKGMEFVLKHFNIPLIVVNKKVVFYYTGEKLIVHRE